MMNAKKNKKDAQYQPENILSNFEKKSPLPILILMKQ